ncbi:MAG TPA: branched-chain amino acid ABC transporter permease, partial [Tepidisphaeraceae bacterium]
ASAQTALFVAALLCGGGVAAAAGWVVGMPSLRLRGDYLAIVTLGFGEILRILLQQTNAQLFTREEIAAATLSRLVPPPLGGALGFINAPKVTTVFWTALLTGITILVAWRLKKSTFGRSMIAIRENEIAAESMGVNVTRLKVWAFVIAAFFAGVGGALYAHKMGTSIGPKDAGFSESFNYVIMVVLGGLGSISGAALAAVLYVVAYQWLLEPTHVWHVALVVLAIRLIVWPKDRLNAVLWTGLLVGIVEGLRSLALHYKVELGDYRVILFALVLIGVMIGRPGGLFGTHEITDLGRMRRKLANGGEVAT